MAKKFGNTGMADLVNNVAKTEQEKAQVIALQNIRAENLIDHPENGEDITFTADLEESMRNHGFTDPLEVTDFGMEEGKYMILSGHRRRAAGVKVFGPDFVFPCLVRHFKNEHEARDYNLMANSQRDSAKDPCLYCIRYKMHEDHLKASGFKGSIREKVAERLGMSLPQADRYKKMNDVILPVWDMVRGEIVGMSSVLPMGTCSEAEQLEIYDIMQEALKKDVRLTRETVKDIVEGYKKGKRSWAEIADLPRDSGLPLNGFVNPDSGETKEPSESHRNDDVRHEPDPIAAEWDKVEEQKAQREKEQAEAAQNEQAPEVDETEGGKAEREEKHEPTEEEKRIMRGEEVAKLIHKLDTVMGDVWNPKDGESAKNMVINMGSMVEIMLDEMQRISENWNMADEFEHAVKAIEEAIEKYK